MPDITYWKLMLIVSVIGMINPRVAFFWLFMFTGLKLLFPDQFHLP